MITIISLIIFVSIIIFLLMKKIISVYHIIYSILLLSPFYDILRAIIGNDNQFIGAFLEILIFTIWLFIFISKVNIPKFGIIEILIIGYLIISFFEIFFSPSIFQGLYVWRWYAIGPIIYLTFRNFSYNENIIKKISYTLCIGLILSAIFILYEYFFLGTEKSIELASALGFSIFYRYDWRLSGTFSSPLIASSSFSILFLLSISQLLYRKNIVFNLFAIILSIFAIFVTMSRSGIVICFIGLIFGLIIAIIKSPKYMTQTLPFIIIIGVIIVFIGIKYSNFFHLVNLAFSSNLSIFDQIRIKNFQNIINESINKYPLGMGFGGGGAISYEAYKIFGGNKELLTNISNNAGDSVFLAILQTSGFFGFISYILFFLFCAYFSIKTFFKTTNNFSFFTLFYGVLVISILLTFGNLIDVWPLRFYIWFFSAVIISNSHY